MANLGEKFTERVCTHDTHVCACTQAHTDNMQCRRWERQAHENTHAAQAWESELERGCERSAQTQHARWSGNFLEQGPIINQRALVQKEWTTTVRAVQSADRVEDEQKQERQPERSRSDKAKDGGAGWGLTESWQQEGRKSKNYGGFPGIQGTRKYKTLPKSSGDLHPTVPTPHCVCAPGRL